MGVTWSSVTDCLGSISSSPSASRYNRLPSHHRSHSPSSSPVNTRSSADVRLRQRGSMPTPGHIPVSSDGGVGSGRIMEDKLKMCAVASQGAAIAPPPPPLVPDGNAVYDLLDDEEEDVCPTCLECYEDDNPKITSKCGHSFHLQCIIAWETRSGSRFCPICAKVMEYVDAEGNLI